MVVDRLENLEKYASLNLYLPRLLSFCSHMI